MGCNRCLTSHTRSEVQEDNVIDLEMNYDAKRSDFCTGLKMGC